MKYADNKHESKFDIVVIGGGPSGLMAATAAGERGASVVLVDKGNRLGQKLAISGGGRCNVTNAGSVEHIIRHIPGNGRFLYSAFASFNNQDIIHFFESLGVALKEENDGRMFPATDKAQTVVQALIEQAKRVGVEIRTRESVREVIYENGHVSGIRLAGGSVLAAKCVIVATGGKSVPHTGSTGDGYAWAEAAGHTITELYPTEVPLVSDENFIRDRSLQGLSLRDVALSVLNSKGKTVITHRGDLIFTHFGISGPIALRCSQFVVKERKKNGGKPVVLSLDMFPDFSREALANRFDQKLAAELDRTVKNVLKTIVPERFARLLLASSELDEQLQARQLSSRMRQLLLEKLKSFRFEVSGTLPLEKAFVTGGGVHLKEIDPRTMESKLMNGLYFCGEILDVHGYTGGYNITAAFVTGHTAGRSAAEAMGHGK